VSPDQGSECVCNTQFCGAGMLDTSAAVTAALRPTAVAQAMGVIGANRTLTLDGTGSGAAINRSLSGYQWSVFSTSGGASIPVISNANQATASVLSPSTGSYTLQLVVTDNTGATDSAQVSVTAATSGGGTDSTNPPPTANGNSGGGAVSTLTLCALALLTFIAVRRRRRA
jgi:serine protease